jgi:copper chaperone CopZ
MMNTTTLQISGMHCGHCAQAVTKSLAAVPGVTDVQVRLESGQATVAGNADAAQLIGAVEAAGYRAQAHPA